MLRVLNTIAIAVLLAAPAIAAPALKESKADLYFPTRVGAKWVYEDDGQTLTMVVTKVESKGEAYLVTVGKADSDGKTSHFQTVEVSRTGLREVENSGRKCEPPIPILRLPHMPGQKWEATITLDGDARGTSTMTVGEADRLSVPAGTYQAVRVDTNNEHGQLTNWYAPGVGVVKIKYGGGKWTRELKLFDPGK